MRFKQKTDYDGAVAVDDGPEVEFRKAERARDEAQGAYAEAQARLSSAEAAFSTAREAHLAAVSRKAAGADADTATTRARMVECEDAVTALRLGVAEGLQRLRDADASFQPLHEAHAQQMREAQQAELAAQFRAALGEARKHFDRASEAVKRMQQASDKLFEPEHIDHGGRRLAEQLRRESDGLPVVTGRLAFGQLGGVR